MLGAMPGRAPDSLVMARLTHQMQRHTGVAMDAVVLDLRGMLFVLSSLGQPRH